MGILDRAQIWFQYSSKRPLGVVAMILGIEDEKDTPQLFCVPVGYYFSHKAASACQRVREAVHFLEKKRKHNPSLSFREIVHMAISELQFTLKEDFKATEIEVGGVRTDDPSSRLLTEAEIDEHLKAINLDVAELKALLHSTLTSVHVLDTHLATICLLRAGLYWPTVCCIVFQPGFVDSKLTILDWMLMAEIELEIVCDGAQLRPTPWPSFSTVRELQLGCSVNMDMFREKCLVMGTSAGNY